MRDGRLLITGMDIATSCGVADGCATDNKPRAWTWNLRDAGKDRPARFSMLMRYCERYFAENQVDGLFYETGLPIGALFAQVEREGAQAAFKMGASDETIGFLRGAIGIVEACAAKARIPRIEGVRVQTARAALLGSGRIPAGQGKTLVRDKCRMLGWPAANDDEADALCIWNMGLGIMSPLNNYKSLPIFGVR